MKKFLFLMLAAILLLPACTEPVVSAPTWQEQYDLGVRYLSEGNYEEAIIAFTVAIEINPKQAPAYVGRGDAYVQSGETEKDLTAAQVDYEKAIELDELLSDAYLGLADVYIHRGDYAKAIEVLQQGLEKTGEDQNIKDKLVDLSERYNSQEKIGNQQAEQAADTYRPEENLVIPLNYVVLESENGIEDILSPVYITDGGKASKNSNSVSTFLYGHIDVNCLSFVDGRSYIVRGVCGVDENRLRDIFFQMCPLQYADSIDKTIENMNYASYDELFERISQTESHGGGWSSSELIDESSWLLAVACYDSSGNRIGYTIFQMNGEAVQQIKDMCMVTVDTATGELMLGQR